MIPMSELIKDSAYRKFLETKPATPKVSRDPSKVKSPPWVVYVQREANGPWGTKSFWKYSEAFHFFRKWMKAGAYDATINNKRIAFGPPQRLARIKGKFVVGTDGVKRQATKFVTWKVSASLLEGQPEHFWCMYCRRPTVFRAFSKHKRLGSCDPSVRRCVICGASERIAIPADQRRYR